MPYTAVNIWSILKQNIFMKKDRIAYFKFRLLFQSNFRHWLYLYMKNRDSKSIEKGKISICALHQYSLNLYDSVVGEVTQDPNEVSYHHEPLISIQKGKTESEIQSHSDVYSLIKKYGTEFYRIKNNDNFFSENHPSGLFKNVSAAFYFSGKVIDSRKYCLKLKEYLETKGVIFIKAKTTGFIHENNKITAVKYDTSEG
mmetsp:Transcript_11317/g.10001  ORF Transcript_11317/g.10001 Transcript_11317/m.10001 type:complete len:199 (+) Transcript_11317:186-782(+)